MRTHCEGRGATDTKLTRSSDSTVLFDQTRIFDAVGNVATLGTTLPTGTDNQAFCYDEQNRLTWASSASGSLPCGGTLTAGTLASAQYGPSSFTFDTLDRMTGAGGNSYTYGDSAHLHSATAIGTANWTASYDAAGDMTCREPTSATTCAGTTPTGAQLSYDNEGRLSNWQNAPSSPTTTDQFLYDGAGQRVAQQVTSGGATTTTTYVGQVEELSTTGGVTMTTTYYYAGGKRVALAVNGSFSYLGADGLGSSTVALDSTGNVQASVLYGPYGTTRYSSGTMPGSYGYTGQHADATTGLSKHKAALVSTTLYTMLAPALIAALPRPFARCGRTLVPPSSMMMTEWCSAAWHTLAVRFRAAYHGGRTLFRRGSVGGSRDTLEHRPTVGSGGGSIMAHHMSVTLTDKEYAELSTEAAKSGKPVEVLVHDILAQRFHLDSPPAPPPHAMSNRTFTEQQYREGKVLKLPTREPLTAHEAAERERRALLLAGGTSASDMVIEDRGPR